MRGITKHRQQFYDVPVRQRSSGKTSRQFYLREPGHAVRTICRVPVMACGMRAAHGTQDTGGGEYLHCCACTDGFCSPPRFPIRGRKTNGGVPGVKAIMSTRHLRLYFVYV